MPDPINVNNPLFFAPEPATFELATRERQSKPVGTNVPGAQPETLELMKEMIIAVADLGDLLTKGEDVSKTVGKLAGLIGKLIDTLANPSGQGASAASNRVAIPTDPNAPPGGTAEILI